MSYLYLKSIHIIFMVTWFSGLFYMVRLMVYTRESYTDSMDVRNILIPQLLLMQRRLWYIIAWPGALGTSFFGLWMLWQNPSLLKLPWMHIKLFLVLLLWFYHLWVEREHRRQKKSVFQWNPMGLRLMNEVPTLLLTGIVFLVVVKSDSAWITGFSVLIILAGLIFSFSWIYKKKREKLFRKDYNSGK